LRATGYDTDHYLVVAKIREILALIKQTTHRVHMESFNIMKLNEAEGMFAALENLDTEVVINRAWETSRENRNISTKESL
jgi:hypothetical protein